MTHYVELQVLTHFSLLRGASSPEELFAAAAPDGSAGADGPAGGSGGAGAEGEEQVWLASAHQLLGRYFELEDPTRLEPAERELRKVPFFVRGKARRNTEIFAASRGLSEIGVDTLYEDKDHHAR